MTRHKGFISLLFACLLICLTVFKVLAHAELKSAVPAPGQELTQQPREIRLTFTEPVSQGSTITLYAEGFREIPGLNAAVDPENTDQLVTAVPDLEPGVYSVQWQIISTDGHPASGSYTFGVLPEAVTNRSGFLILGGILMILLGGSAILLIVRRNPST